MSVNVGLAQVFFVSSYIILTLIFALVPHTGICKKSKSPGIGLLYVHDTCTTWEVCAACLPDALSHPKETRSAAVIMH